MRKYLTPYMLFLLEEEEKAEDKKKDPNQAKKIASKVQDKGEKDITSVSGTVKSKSTGKPVAVSKDLQLQKLSKELYKAQYDVATFKYILADKVAVMKQNGADEDTIAKAEEMGADQMANVQLRVDAISAQMVALAGASAGLAMKADELAQSAVNAALKAAQEFYNKRAAKWLKDSKEKKKAKDSEKESKDDEKEDKE